MGATALVTFFVVAWGIFFLLKGLGLRIGIDVEWGNQSPDWSVLTSSASQPPEFHIPERELVSEPELAGGPQGLSYLPSTPHPAGGSHVLYSQQPSSPSQALAFGESAS